MSTDHTQHCDALVIGAGPAGSLIAHALASRGTHTRIVDRAAFPRHKVCGCCLAQGGQQALARAGLQNTIDDAGTLDTMTLHHRRRSAAVHIPTYKTITRDVMDARLLNAARDAGVETFTAVAARLTGEPGVAVMTDANGESHTLHARVVILADGIAGTAAKDIDAIAWRVHRASHVGLSATLDRARFTVPDTIAMHATPLGYVGIAPAGPHATALAAAIRPSAIRSHGAIDAINHILDAASQHPPIQLDAETRIRGVPALTRRRESPEHAGWLLAIGDAAGYVEPFTGEGMSWALQSAEAAVEHACAIIEDRYRIGTWSTEARRLLRWEHRGCRVVSAALRTPFCVDAAITAAGIMPRFARAVASLLVGSTPGRTRPEPAA
jgi:flavin-dependent dehydrogenase